MPILPAECDLFPDDLLDGGADDASASQWWALYTLPRREKELMRRLRVLGIAHYVPLVKQRRRSPGGRVQVSHVPLFAGYAFVRGDETDRYRAACTGCVCRCLEVDDPAGLVRDLGRLRRLLAADVPLTPEARLEPGMKVRIRSGAMAGLEGTVVRRRGGDRLTVAVHFLQQGASVLLEDFDVERIDG